MVKIAPSILSADFLNLERDVRLISDGGADYIHFDVMDGHFVPNLTLGVPFVRAMKKFTSVPLDVHLMIMNPEVQVPWYIEAGADIITFHIEAASKPQQLIEQIHAAKRLAGISINPDTPVSAVAKFINQVDLILVMSVYPGFGGQSYIEGSEEKLRELAQMRSLHNSPDGKETLLEIDGGINEKTAPLAVAAGADILVAGNAIFGASDPILAMEKIRNASSLS